VIAYIHFMLIQQTEIKKMKKNRKCKKCQGKGFIFGKNYIIKEGSFGYEQHEYGIKITCTNCFGKGVK
ncbi:hypothetical protein COK88_31255, partial [Bacillus cereus]|uniref:hypothetical protein n=1 Tax=Bacillus cereus TaxID=1396 RepID=UPI000BF88092